MLLLPRDCLQGTPRYNREALVCTKLASFEDGTDLNTETLGSVSDGSNHTSSQAR